MQNRSQLFCASCFLLLMCLPAHSDPPPRIVQSIQYEGASLDVVTPAISSIITNDSAVTSDSFQLETVEIDTSIPILNVDQVFSSETRTPDFSYNATLVGRIMLRYEGLENTDRDILIENLTKEVEKERDGLYERGFVDGTGLLYQITGSYLALMEFCTDEELIEVHNAIIPAAPYVPPRRHERTRRRGGQVK